MLMGNVKSNHYSYSFADTVFSFLRNFAHLGIHMSNCIEQCIALVWRTSDPVFFAEQKYIQKIYFIRHRWQFFLGPQATV